MAYGRYSRIAPAFFRGARCDLSHAPEEILEAEHFRERSGAGNRPRGHEPAEYGDNDAAEDGRYEPWNWSRSRECRLHAPNREHQENKENAQPHNGPPKLVRTTEIIAAPL